MIGHHILRATDNNWVSLTMLVLDLGANPGETFRVPHGAGFSIRRSTGKDSAFFILTLPDTADKSFFRVGGNLLEDSLGVALLPLDLTIVLRHWHTFKISLACSGIFTHV